MPLERKKRYLAIRKEARDAGNSGQGMKVINGNEKNAFLPFIQCFLMCSSLASTVAGANKSIQCISSNNPFPPTLKF